MILDEEPWHRLILEPNPGENFNRVEMMVPVLKNLIDLAQFNDYVDDQVERNCGMTAQCIGCVSLETTEWGSSISVDGAAVECPHPQCPLDSTDFGGGAGDREPSRPVQPTPKLVESLEPESYFR